MISIIVAMGKNNVIGGNNSLLWKLPADMKRFKELTQGHTVIMGRKTYESIGHALPNRKNIVITRDPNYRAENCIVATSLKEALTHSGKEEIFIIGGGEIYHQALDAQIVDKIYATEIDHEFQGDTYFPKIDTNMWKETSRVMGTKDEKNPYNYYFVTFERASPITQ